MEEQLDKWEDFITKLVERKKHEVKDKVIERSEFLSFLENKDEWEGRSIIFSSDIEKYYRKKEIQDNVIDPKLMYSIINGDEGYDFAERWISEEMLDKSFEHFARTGIDKLFISEICNKDNYSTEKLIKKSKEEFQNTKEVLESIRKAISSQIESGSNKKDLILVIGKEISHSLFFASSDEYRRLKESVGRVIEKYKELENNFWFALVNKNDLKFRWIFWGLKLDYNIFNLYTYILLHVWYNVEREEHFSSNSIAYLKED